eukprot:2203287-Pyramimonas_sp.AAC.1
MGADMLHLREFGDLSDGALECLGLLWFWREVEGPLSSCVSLVLLAQLLKPEGGYRPTGIMIGVSRVFGEINRAEAVSWERDHYRDYQCGVQGRSCEQAVWEQS